MTFPYPHQSLTSGQVYGHVEQKSLQKRVALGPLSETPVHPELRDLNPPPIGIRVQGVPSSKKNLVRWISQKTGLKPKSLLVHPSKLKRVRWMIAHLIRSRFLSGLKRKDFVHCLRSWLKSSSSGFEVLELHFWRFFTEEPKGYSPFFRLAPLWVPLVLPEPAKELINIPGTEVGPFSKREDLVLPGDQDTDEDALLKEFTPLSYDLNKLRGLKPCYFRLVGSKLLDDGSDSRELSLISVKLAKWFFQSIEREYYSEYHKLTPKELARVRSVRNLGFGFGGRLPPGLFRSANFGPREWESATPAYRAAAEMPAHPPKK